MPTDENNGVNPQNQQVNPNQQVDSNLVGNQAVKDSGDPDDFDFSFDDSNGSGKGGDIQAQMKREGRSGMFLSPDENMRKKEEEEPAENVVIPTKKRSGMFLTPDEESEKEIAENDGETFSFHDQNDPNSVDSSEKEDAYLAEIDPSDVEDDPTDKFNALGSDSSQDEDHDGKLDEEIEDLISFGNTDNSSNNNVNSAVPEQPVAAPTEPETTVPEQPVAAPAEPEVTVPEQPVAAPTEPETTVPKQPVAAPAEPEVAVPEQPVAAPTEPETTVPEQPVAAPVEPVTVPEQPVAAPAEPETTVSEQPVAAPAEPETTVPEQPVAAPTEPETTVPEQPVVAQEQNSEGEKNWLDEEDQKVNDTFGTSENLDNANIAKDIDISPANVAENVENVIVGDVANTNGVGNNVIEENNLTNLGNDLHIENLGTDVVENSNGDLVSDLGGGNVSNEQYIPNEAEFSQMSDLLNSSSTGPIDLNNIENQVQQNIANQAPVNDVVIDVPANTENQINLQIDPAPVTNGAGTNQVELNNTVIEQPQGTIDLDKIQGGISLDAMIDNDIQDIHIQPQQNGAEQQTQPAGLNQSNVQVQQPVKAKKHKKQSGFIILGVFGFLFVAGFVLYKMFPDKVMDLFKHDAIVQSLTGTENNDEEGNEVNVDENQGSELENNGEGNIGEEGENNENQGDEPSGEEIDPNSLAGLLEGNEDSGEGNENNEEGVVNGEEGNQLGSEEETSNGGDEGEFDPFSEMNELLGVDDENKSKLNDYISKGQYYIDWGTENSNAAAKRYGEAIVSSAQDQLTKLENGEEIDTTLFDRFDNYLKVLSDLESNN